MVKFLTSDNAVLFYLIAIALSLMVVGAYVVLKFRDFSDDDAPSTSELMTTFRDLHDEGGLSDAEYRTIKSSLTERMQAELRGSDETGSDDSAAGDAAKS